MVSWLYRIKNNLRIGKCTKKSGLVKIFLLTWSKKHWSIKLCFSFSLLSSLLIMLSLLTWLVQLSHTLQISHVPSWVSDACQNFMRSHNPVLPCQSLTHTMHAPRLTTSTRHPSYSNYLEDSLIHTMHAARLTTSTRHPSYSHYLEDSF